MGDDKAFLDWEGKPLWRSQIEKLLKLEPERVFLAARSEQNFSAHIAADPVLNHCDKLEVIEDPEGEDCGPIGALIRCLKRADLPLLVLAVDMPRMSVECLSQMLAAASPGSGIVLTGRHGHETLAAIYDPAMLPQFETALIKGDFSLQSVISAAVAVNSCQLKTLDGMEEELFSNVNTREEAARILRFQA